MDIKKIDNMGRLTIPAEYRHQMGLHHNDKVVVTFTGGKIVIEKLENVLSKN